MKCAHCHNTARLGGTLCFPCEERQEALQASDALRTELYAMSWEAESLKVGDNVRAFEMIARLANILAEKV